MKKRMIHFFVSVVFLGYLPFCFSQQDFQLFTLEDGLKEHFSHSFTQDDQGFIWFLNGSHLFRYDGYNFLEYDDPPRHLAGGKETSNKLFSFQDSLLFIATNHHGLIFNPKINEWKSFHPKKNTRDAYTFTQVITTPKKELIVTATFPKQLDSLSFFKIKEDGFHLLPFFEKNKVDPAFHFLQEDIDGNFYFIKGKTVFKTNPQGSLIRKIPIHALDVRFDKKSNIKGVFNRSGKLIILYNSLFYQSNDLKDEIYPHQINRFLDLSKETFRDFTIAKNGDLWVCGMYTNLLHYDQNRDTIINYSKPIKAEVNRLSYGDIGYHSIFEDRTGIIWSGGNMGFTKLIPSSALFETYLTDKIYNINDNTSKFYSFRAFAEDDKRMIYASYYHNIGRLNTNTQQCSFPFSNISYYPFDLHFKEGFLWRNNGDKIDVETGELIRIQGRPKHESDIGVLAEDDQGDLYLASLGKLRKLVRNETVEFWKDEIQVFSPSIVIEEMYYGKKSKKLWITGNRELISYDLTSKLLHRYDLKKMGLPLTQIFTIEEDTKGNLWMGTADGLIYFHPTDGLLKNYTVVNGLPNNYICGILLEGDSCIWLSTNFGLSRFHINEESFTNFYKEDGLPNNEFNRKSYFKASNGKMYFGGLKGFVSFFPKQVMQKKQIKNESAQLVLSSFEHIDERQTEAITDFSFSKNSELHLYHWDRSFTFSYLLTDYNHPEEISFSYIMDGYENKWSIPSKFNFARYSGLPPGNYNFKVKARDSKGRWHPSQLIIKVTVHPPWWKTGWAYLIYFTSGLAFTIPVFRFLNRRWILQAEIKQKDLMLKEIHHRVKNNLQIISSLLSLQSRTISDKTAKNAILGSESRVRSMSIIHKKLYQGENLAIVEMKSYFESLSNNLIDVYGEMDQEIDVHLVMDSINLDVNYAIPLGLIVNELITNSLKYAFKNTNKGTINIRLIQQNEELVLIIGDNGSNQKIEFLPTDLESHGFGTSLVQMLTEQLKGEISQNTEKGYYTKIRFPYSKSIN